MSGAPTYEVIGDSEWIGKPTMRGVVHVERQVVSNFAMAVTDRNPIYRREPAATEAGFDTIPAPPTYGFAMQPWGAYEEDQPGDDPVSPVAEIVGPLMASGGLVLHGEQEFFYHRPIVAGDVLHGEGRLIDHYSRESSSGRVMTFIVTEDSWCDPDGEPVLTTRFNLIHRA